MRRGADIYGGRDPRTLPFYTLAEAAKIVGMPRPTVRVWVAGRGKARAIFPPADPKRLQLSFLDLIQVYVLRSLRTVHEVKMSAAKAALKELERHSKTTHPLATENLLTARGGVFLEKYNALIRLDASSQIVIRQVLEQALRRVNRDAAGKPIALFPVRSGWDSQDQGPIAVNPSIAFGQPVVAGTRVLTAEVASRINAGDTAADVAEDLRLTDAQVRDALLFEKAIAA